MPHIAHILAFGFLAPLLMGAGAAATSIPIIIHLLNKRKFRVVVWAAMDWLLAAQRRNARRLRFQRWLLLALRCLALLIIAAGIAQLVLTTQAFAFIGAQQAVVIIWDDSYSMGYQGHGAGAVNGTAFEHSRQLISDYITRLKPSDKLLILRASRLSAGAPEAAAAQPTLDHASALAQVHSAVLTDSSTNLPAAFDQAAQALKDIEASTSTRQVILLTDLSNSSIHDPVRGVGATNDVQGVQGDRIKKSVEAMQAHASMPLTVIDVGSPDQTNMAITGIRPKRPAVVAGAPTSFEITVFNATLTTQNDVPITVLLDGVPAQTTKLNKIEAGASSEVEVSNLKIPSVGRHLIEARLPGDLLPVDDTRRLIVNARREVPVLLVDGRPGDGGRTTYDSTAYLWAAYGLPSEGKSLSIFAPKVITELDLPTAPLNTYDVVVLSDIGEPPAALRDALKRYVEQGGLLIIFPGSRTDAQRMNDALGEKGVNLLPATFGQPVKLESAEQIAQGITFAPENYTHPVLQPFADDVKQGKKVGVDLVHTNEYLLLGVPADGSSEVILRYAKPDGSPGNAAVVKKDVGAGRVVVFASTADTLWNDWGGKPSFLPFIQELTFYSLGTNTLTSGANLTLRVGERMHLPADTAAPGSWIAPRDTRVNVTSEIDKEGRAFLTSSPLTLAGTYAPAGGDARPIVAVNPDPEEADIRYVTPTQMAAALGIDAKNILEQPVAISAEESHSDNGGSTLGPGLIATALVVFLVETVLAMFFSMYR